MRPTVGYGSFMFADRLLTAAREQSVSDERIDAALVEHERAAKGDTHTRTRIERYRRNRTTL